MYYSSIGTLAVLILLIENQDILRNRSGSFSLPAWKAYRRFLYAVLVYYITDIAWGWIEAAKLPALLFADTTVYFVTMGAGIFCWTQYVVTYLGEEGRFSRFLLHAGRIFAALVAALAILNIFKPILFSVDADCVYTALDVRYAILIGQVLLLILVSVYMLTAIIRRKGTPEKNKRYRTLGFFGLIMAIFLTVQLWFPYLPLYAIAYLLGTCLLRAVVIGDEKEEYKGRMEEAERVRELGQSITSMMDNMPALSFSKDAETGVYLACNQAFAEYACKASPDGVIGLTDADIFDAETAAKFVKDDRVTLSMERPHIILEDVPDADGNPRHFQTTKLKFVDAAGRTCLLGMCQDVAFEERIRRAEELAEEQHIAYARINALSGDYLSVHVVDPESGDYWEYSATEGFKSFSLPVEGRNFFETTREMSADLVYPEDLERFMHTFTRENVMTEIRQNGIFTLTYRLLVHKKPVYVQLKAAMVDEKEGRRLIVGINDIDVQVRQEEEYARRLTQAQNKASIDALTGVKNRHAYLNAEEKLDRQIAEKRNPAFAVSILDINDLKKINDTSGHQAGDQYIVDACRVICKTFKHSPVYRVGGDEFAVISQGEDYAHLEELAEMITQHNAQALREDGIVIACGTAKFMEGDPCVASVFERADQEMYKNKNGLKASAE